MIEILKKFDVLKDLNQEFLSEIKFLYVFKDHFYDKKINVFFCYK
jgi:hypothetical protein